MKKIIIMLFLFVGLCYGQITDEGTVVFGTSKASPTIELGAGFCLSEIYLPTAFKGTKISFHPGDIATKTNFTVLYVNGDSLYFSVPTSACRVNLQPIDAKGNINWKVYSDSTETCTIGWKAILIK